METLIINGISKKFNKNSVALDNINLEIQGIYGLLGPNGAGKTTLMRILSTLLNQSAGTISFNSLKWNNQKEVRKIIGYLPQHFSIYPTISVYECLNHLAILKGIKERQQRLEQIDNLLIEVNLEDVKDKKIKDLSGGMLRRVGIAQALLGNPKIIIIDEPTAGLDIEERVRFRNLLRKIAINKVVIISTHIVEDLEYTCDYLCVLKKGKVLAKGSRQEIANFAKNLVWEIQIDSNDKYYDKIRDDYNIISTKKSELNKYIFRILSKKQPLPQAYSVNPSLEDGYLLLMKDDVVNG